MRKSPPSWKKLKRQTMVDKVGSLKFDLSELIFMVKFVVPGSNPGGNPKNLWFHYFKLFITEKNWTTFTSVPFFMKYACFGSRTRATNFLKKDWDDFVSWRIGLETLSTNVWRSNFDQNGGDFLTLLLKTALGQT